MKLVSGLALGFATVLSSFVVNAAEIGGLEIAGNGCSVPVGSHELYKVPGQAGRVGIPLKIAIAKKIAPAFERKVCTFALPVSLDKNEKLQIVDVSQYTRLSASKGTKVTSSLSVFLVGQQTAPMTLTAQGIDHTSRVVTYVQQAGIVAESKCGEDTMVRGNLNALAQGENRATAATGAVILTLKVVSCN